MNDWAPECEKKCADGGECAYYCHRAAHAKSEANKGATNPAPAIPVKPACLTCHEMGAVSKNGVPFDDYIVCPDCGGEEP